MTNASAANGDIATMTFEAAMTELEKIVRDLESGQTTLENSIAAYDRGVALKKHCEARLEDARLKVEKITLGADGTPAGAVPFATE